MSRTTCFQFFGRLFGVLAASASLALVADPAPAVAGPVHLRLHAPSLSSPDAGLDSIDITVTAAECGANSGFTIQWMPSDDLAARGGIWPLIPGYGNSAHMATFSGLANCSRYDLDANESVTVRIGDLLMDEGVWTDCPEPLECDTGYAFRVVAHSSINGFRSPFSPTFSAETDPCFVCDEAVHNQDYWIAQFGAWPTDSLSLGSVFYWDFEIQAILTTPADGNGYLTLAHQLIVAELNLLNGAGMDYFDAISADLSAGHILMGGAIPPPIGTDEVTGGAAAAHEATAAALDAQRFQFDCDEEH
jgi:hypothetical protein